MPLPRPRRRRNGKRIFQQNLPLPRPTRLDHAQSSGGANQEQRQAIHSRAKNILVTAGPGTGKTFTLVQRLLYLIDRGWAIPQRTYLITFTNKAAEEISQRLTNAIGEKAGAVFVGTFHQFCLFWLRQWQPDLRVVGPSERMVLLRRLFPDIGLSEKQVIAEEVSTFFQNYSGPGQKETLSAPVRRYTRTIEEGGLLDIDGIIPFFLEQLDAEEDFAGRIRQAVGTLLVDEFQDVNPAQYRLVCRLACQAATFAIGDPDQAIYGFRGSNPELFQRFAALSPDGDQVTSITLHRNYRNAGKILAAAQKLISNNHNQRPRELTALSEEEALLEYHQAASPDAEAQYIVQRIEEIVGGISNFSINSGRGGDQGNNSSFADIAILIRLNSQARVIRDALEKRGIPCQLVGLPPFFMEGDFRLASLWILALAGLAETGDYLQLFAGLPGVGHGSLGKLEDFALHGGDFLDPESLALFLPRQHMPVIEGFLEALNNNRSRVGTLDIRHLLESYPGLLKLETASDSGQRFLQLAGSFGSDLSAFARHLRRNATATVYDARAEAVSLMTVHGSKGLEFNTIFIAGLEEGILPHNPGIKNFDLAEERRLLYVAITRARQRLILTCCRQRLLHGRAVQLPPSRFIDELPLEALQAGFSRIGTRKRRARQLSLF